MHKKLEKSYGRKKSLRQTYKNVVFQGNLIKVFPEVFCCDNFMKIPFKMFGEESHEFYARKW